ncbi:Ala-tRNA(Pro) hydrolase [Marinosulfonomonas sp. PRT-SC04]|nr:Ala-tRNA(Pro) hydrolase [Marinosulfonomonas sp. PRT-SC04]
MTELLFRSEPYLRESVATVTGHTPEGGVVLDKCLFYATSGGQPGDSGSLTWGGHRMVVATTIKGEAGQIVLLSAEPAPLPPVGTEVFQALNWDRRHRHMRVHTALHLLSVVIGLPVTGGSIGVDKGRLDFAIPEPLADKDALTAKLNEIIVQDLRVTEGWITEAELAANPSLVKTMSVQPPKGQGRVRLIGIGAGAAQIDLQPCGGTHVARTGEIGPVYIGKVQNKGAQNRRVYLHLEN